MTDFVLAKWFKRWHGSVRHNLAASDSESLAIPALLAMADKEDAARWSSMYLGYAEPTGSEWLRASVANLYDTLAQNQVACFSGAQEGMFCAMHALLRPGDHAVIITPNYQTAEMIPASICAVTGVGLRASDAWSLDLEAVRSALRPTTRLISVNFPNNPTGALPPRDVWDGLVTLCRQHGVWLFSDEVYRLIERDPQRRLPAAADIYERGISLNVVSKAYGLAGLRVGWLACQDAAMLRQASEVREHLSGSGAVPSEVLANIAIKATDRIVGRNRALAEGNLDVVDRFFAERSDVFSWTRPDGGVVGYPLYRGTEGVEAFSEQLAARSGILVLPGSAFTSGLTPSPANHFRIGFGRADLPEAMDALADHLVGGLQARPASSTRTASCTRPGIPVVE